MYVNNRSSSTPFVFIVIRIWQKRTCQECVLIRTGTVLESTIFLEEHQGPARMVAKSSTPSTMDWTKECVAEDSNFWFEMAVWNYGWLLDRDGLGLGMPSVISLANSRPSFLQLNIGQRPGMVHIREREWAPWSVPCLDLFSYRLCPLLSQSPSLPVKTRCWASLPRGTILRPSLWSFLCIFIVDYGLLARLPVLWIHKVVRIKKGK